MSMTTEQKTAFDKIPTSFVGKFLEMGLSEIAVLTLWEDGQKALKDERAKNGDARKEQKADAEANAARKAKELSDRCEELDIPVPGLAKSLHRTDKKVGEKVPQVLCGVKVRIEGISGSFDRYIPTGKGGKVTPKIEAKVIAAQNEILRMLDVLVDAGFKVGDEETEEA